MPIFLVASQINFGTFSLGQNKRGDLQVGFNQAANIFGFGGDRGIGFTIGEGRFDTNGIISIILCLFFARNGMLVAGERVGVDSDVVFNEAEGINVGNILNFGKNHNSSNNLPGQFLSFLQRIGNFFSSMNKSTGTTLSPAAYDNSNALTRNISHNLSVAEKQELFVRSKDYKDSENADYKNYYNYVMVNF
ncbi:unnamed protein product [Thelazia callipaeda]|uniref:Uncharacterized protein n=1 Tax=Thelazia callipaeda TaxID=103827 RepID=A0A0N5D2C2_THECL|nr:unnamed protein product [Thelazia callipaeda]